MDGPGLVVFAGAFPDPAVVDRATGAFNAMIADQHASGRPAGDHFAKPGANDRVWNALEKLAVRDPEVFVDYYANDIMALVATAWLGPAYQVTSQINVVNPGGQAQTVHRDYHLGFQTDDQVERFPAHVHQLSPVLTLQGAVAHTDMPVVSGPTQYLPHSQKYPLGYLAWRRPELREYFEASFVQLPLAKGDAAFFNPALFHAAGTNRSADIRRMANLLQISSAFGRAMESVDREKVATAVFPALSARRPPGAGRALPGQRDRRQRRGLRLPHQPRPRPAGGRPGPADPGRDRGPGCDRGLGRRCAAQGARGVRRAPADGRHLTGLGRGGWTGRSPVRRFCSRTCPRATSRSCSSWISTSHSCCSRPRWIGVPVATSSPSRTARRKSVWLETPTTCPSSPSHRAPAMLATVSTTVQ